MTGHPMDLCECGDYRSDHEAGQGRCLKEHSHLPCGRFELAGAHPGGPEEADAATRGRVEAEVARHEMAQEESVEEGTE